MKFIKKYYGVFALFIFVLLFSLFQLYIKNQTNSFFENPKKGDIYIFQSDSLFYSYLIESVIDDSICFYGYQNDFLYTFPSKEDLDLNLFDNKMLYIYDVAQLKEFKKNKKIIKIFR